ncbi:MAG: chromosome segregation protein SMC [Ignavibacteriales bacterium]|nr:MAG: chromosome segregation protein SMC [Ignavibacteriales bacterium]
MYLSKLELFGFKSFANKTIVEFNKGVTAIVGPNGCGKTNIVDGIRWALGEQKTTTLRSDKMENVIFNGTQNKKPMGMSEVSLTLVNDLGILPTEYSEVTITRRIFRSGESEYLLNKNLCRLKDITNLFMDTGMGTNAYSVIELKMVETILSNKADERRTMFEEAAGVNKYKLRRRLSLKKLEDIRKDLTRVNDIVSEVEKQVNSLERQAKKADRYNRISTTLREFEIDLSEREYALWNRKKSESKTQKENYLQQRIQLDSQLRSLDDGIKELRERISVIESELNEKRKELAEQNKKIYSVQSSISVANERKSSFEKNLERYKQELIELHAQDEETDILIADTHENIEDLIAAITEKAEKIELNEKLLEEQKTELEIKKASLKQQNEIVQEKVIEITKKEKELSALQSIFDETSSGIENFNNKILNITNTIAKTVGYLEELEQEKQDVEKKIAESDKLYVQKQEEKTSLEKKLSDLRGKEIEERGIINSIKDKIDFLQSLISNLEGVSKGAKVLIENEGWTDKEKTLLADVGEAEDKFRFAIEASLKNVLNNLLVDSFADLQRAITYLQKNDLGKASFYVLGMDTNGKQTLLEKLQAFSHKRKRKKIEKENGFLGWAHQFVQTEERWKPFFEKLLINTALIENLELAVELSKKYKGFNFTTLNGDLIHESGIIDAGSLPKLDETLFGRKKLLQNLRNDFPKYLSNLETLKNDILVTEQQVEEINLKELSDQNRILLNDMANIEKQITQFEFEKKKLSDEIDNLRKDIQVLVNKSNQTDNQIQTLTAALQNDLDEKASHDESYISIETEVKTFEEDYNTKLSAYNQLRLELERLLGEKKNSENSIERAKLTKDNIIKTIQKRESDIEMTKESLASLEISTEEKIIELSGLEEKQHLLINDENEISTRLKGEKTQAAEKEKQITDLRKNRDWVSDEIHSIDIKVNEISLKIDNLFEHIKEEYSLTLELKEFEDLDTFNFEERNAEVHNYKQQIKNLGPINLLAYSEFEEERQRLDFLHKQRNDLVDSEKDLLKTIDEINITAQNLFQDTFSKIRDNFIKIFQSLFNPGDEADLKLEENVDPLEGKIEIIAKPKGKRPTSIELLSGGEKTLTAIALLFAIYLVKPSPFCILDEVDAPLDDANIDRFTKIIKEFSASTQFIMVTHNKRTMEAAETMYGVTMQEEGISRLVSVQFNDELKNVSQQV